MGQIFQFSVSGCTSEIERSKKVLLDGTDEEAAEAYRKLSPPVRAFFEHCLAFHIIKSFQRADAPYANVAHGMRTVSGVCEEPILHFFSVPVNRGILLVSSEAVMTDS
jgi:hypothetical protein